MAYQDGVVRVRVVEPEQHGVPPRYEAPDILLDSATLQGKLAPLKLVDQSAGSFTVQAATGGAAARVTMQPFSVQVLEASGSGKPIVSINSKHKMFFEQRKSSSEAARAASGGTSGDANGGEDAGRVVVDWGEDGKPIYADGGDDDDDAEAGGDGAGAPEGEDASAASADAPESFGGHTDNKPNGPTAVGVDVTLHGARHAFGIPEHASSFSLKSTRGGSNAYSEPYRLYNLDVFEYEIDEPMALYGHIPVVVAHSAAAGTTSVFWNNPSETFVEVEDSQGDGPAKEVRWISESGVFDLMVMVGPTPERVFAQYASVTGTTPVPPMFSLGYHQCRWNYRDEKDVREVNAQFEAHDLPYDVLWLDIEHTDGKRYFTWDKDKFPTPEAMQRDIAHFGRKMVTIVDPHIKRDTSYPVHSEATAKGLYIKDKDGTSDFKGWCWPGDSSYLDFTSPDVRSWWADLFALDKYVGSTDILFTWNDMNEPSVFNGPEVSMTKEAMSLAGVEHREWHNLYGFYQHMATADGQVRRSGGVARPFVLSRSFFAGSQRHGAIWTGDNAAEWSHLKIASDMLLSLNVAGLPFAGADVGGFFKNPDEELLQRWYQAGAFQPFFRGHAHIDTKRREPWLFGEEVLARISKAVRVRYSLLPYWYAVFREHEVSGMPVMRPLWTLAPTDEAAFGLGDQWLVGSDLLVKPVTDAGATEVDVYLPAGTSWYQFEAPHSLYRGGASVREAAPLDKIPVFLRAGSIVPLKMRLRRSTAAMLTDPYTLLVSPDPDSGTARGSIYLDDEATFSYRSGSMCEVKLELADGVLRAESQCGAGLEKAAERLQVERIVILGQSGTLSKVVLETQGVELAYTYDAGSRRVEVRKPARSFISIPFTLKLEH